MIFAREISDPLTSLVKKMESALTQLGPRGIDCYVIVCSDAPDTEAKLRAFTEKEQIVSCAVSLTKAAGPPGFKIPKDADVVAQFFLKRATQAVFVFKKEELTARAIDHVIDAVDGRTEQPFPVGYIAPAYTPRKPLNAGGHGAEKAALGPHPNVLIFAREVSQPLTILASKVDELARDPANKLDSFVILIGEGSQLEESLENLARQQKFGNTTLAVEPADRVRAFRVSKQNDITILVCANGASRGFYTFKARDFGEKSAEKFLGDLKKLLPVAQSRR